MDNKDKLLKKILKNKKLIKSNQSQYIIVPNTWINMLGWQGKKLVMAVNPINEEIIIRKMEEIEYGTEVSTINA